MRQATLASCLRQIVEPALLLEQTRGERIALNKLSAPPFCFVAETAQKTAGTLTVVNGETSETFNGSEDKTINISGNGGLRVYEHEIVINEETEIPDNCISVYSFYPLAYPTLAMVFMYPYFRLSTGRLGVLPNSTQVCIDPKSATWIYFQWLELDAESGNYITKSTKIPNIGLTFTDTVTEYIPS